MYDSGGRARRALAGGDADAAESDESDESARGAGINYSVFSGVVEEKAAACRAVASYAHFCPDAFVPFVPAFAPTLSAMADHMHDVVRAQAHAALARLAQCAPRAAPLGNRRGTGTLVSRRVAGVRRRGQIAQRRAQGAERGRRP